MEPKTRRVQYGKDLVLSVPPGTTVDDIMLLHSVMERADKILERESDDKLTGLDALSYIAVGIIVGRALGVSAEAMDGFVTSLNKYLVAPSENVEP
jgi:hypothetical protein